MVHARVTSEQNPKKLRASEKQQKAEGVVPQQNPAKVHLLPQSKTAALQSSFADLQLNERKKYGLPAVASLLQNRLCVTVTLWCPAFSLPRSDSRANEYIYEFNISDCQRPIHHTGYEVPLGSFCPSTSWPVEKKGVTARMKRTAHALSVLPSISSLSLRSTLPNFVHKEFLGEIKH